LARRILERDPGLADGNVHVAAAIANIGELRRGLAAGPAAGHPRRALRLDSARLGVPLRRAALVELLEPITS
jgi:hypothetical protein